MGVEEQYWFIFLIDLFYGKGKEMDSGCAIDSVAHKMPQHSYLCYRSYVSFSGLCRDTAFLLFDVNNEHIIILSGGN